MYQLIRNIVAHSIVFTAMLLFLDPALAENKFEIIGGGVSGSTQLKKEHIQVILYVVSGILLLFAVLAVALPRRNPLMLNFANWKQSASVLLVLCILCGVSGYVIAGH